MNERNLFADLYTVIVCHWENVARAGDLPGGDNARGECVHASFMEALGRLTTGPGVEPAPEPVDLTTGESDPLRRLARNVLAIHEGGAAPGHELVQLTALAHNAVELAHAMLARKPEGS
jgi:hypothetical protein